MNQFEQRQYENADKALHQLKSQARINNAWQLQAVSCKPNEESNSYPVCLISFVKTEQPDKPYQIEIEARSDDDENVKNIKQRLLEISREESKAT
ncbi:MAG: hypothetical protein M3416_09355 [Acidobacteriota bacterium]|nr:hypothetical protein [Acidobacteriota bacterium]